MSPEISLSNNLNGAKGKGVYTIFFDRLHQQDRLEVISGYISFNNTDTETSSLFVHLSCFLLF